MEQAKKKKDRRILIVLIAFLCLLFVGAGGYFLYKYIPWGQQVAEEEELQYDICWNLDKVTYTDIETGESTREPVDGQEYVVRFLVNGEIKRYNVKQKKILYRIDAEKVMGLVVDENNYVTDVIDINEFTGGLAAVDFYVDHMDDKELVANSSYYNTGEELVVDIKKAPIYDVSEEAEAKGSIAKSVALQDRVTAVKSKSGDILEVYVTERSGNDGEAKLCPHCNEYVVWKVWKSDIKVPRADGHWKVTQDIHLQDQGWVNEGNNVVLDLNGFTVYGNKNARVYVLNKAESYLAIMDLSDAKTGKMVSNGDDAPAGSCIYANVGLLELYSGVLDASQTQAGIAGVAVVVSVSSTFNMYDGTIIGGTSKTVMKTDLSGTQGGGAGSIAVNGIMNMYGGTVKDGKGVSMYKKEEDKYYGGFGGNISIGSKGSFKMYGGEILNGIADRSGGNISASSGCTFEIHGGVVSGGVVELEGRTGGNIYSAANVNFVMTGGTIKDGTCLGQGGNVLVYGQMTMSGGTITGGKVLKDGVMDESKHSHNVYINYADLVMSGGTIDGYVFVKDLKDDLCTVTLSGTARITGGKENLYLEAEKPIIVNTMKKGAKVGVSVAGSFSEKTAYNNAAYFHSDYENTDILHIDNKLYAGRQNCICGYVGGKHTEGCSGKELLWSPWMKKTSLPTAEGNWYLVSDITMNKIQATVAAGSNVALDLCGHTVMNPDNAENVRIYSTNKGGVTLSITDSSEAQTGRLKMQTGDYKTWGLCVWVAAAEGEPKSTFNLYGGTLDASGAVNTQTGGAVWLQAGCTFNMYGGKIVGCTTKQTGASVFARGIFNMYDGIIEGGKAITSYNDKNELIGGNGGNVHVDSNGVFTMHDGTIQSGTAVRNGGNVYVGSEKFVMNGGTITGGVAELSGGNIYLGSRSEVKEVFVMNNGVIEKGVAKGNAHANVGGGNVCIWTKSQFVMNGGTIREGEALGILETEDKTSYYGSGGNVLLYTDGVFKMNGGKVQDGKSASNGGNINMRGGVFEMSGGTLSGGESLYNHGGNLGVILNSTVTISGGTIKDGIAHKWVTVSGEKELQEAPETHNITVNDNTKTPNTLNVSGGKIDGHVKVYGTSATVTLTKEAYIYNGTSKNNLEIDKLDNGALRINVNGLKGDANVHLTHTTVSTPYCFTTANAGTKKSDMDHIHSDKDTPIGYNKATEQLYLGELEEDQFFGACVCAGNGANIEGHSCSALVWTEWSDTTALPSTTGNYCLMEDVTIATSPTKNAFVSKNNSVTIDLNGHTVTNQSGSRAIAINNENATLTITDTSEAYATKPGTIRFSEETGMMGSVLLMNHSRETATNIVNLWNGVLDASAVTACTSNGVAVNISNGCFNMYGGTIKGGVTSNSGGSISVGSGTYKGYFNMYGGTVTGGKAKNGGNIALVVGTVNIAGGTIENGKSSNQSAYAANLYMNNIAGNVLTISGGTIKGHVGINGCAGEINLTGKPVIDNETKKDNFTVTLGELGTGVRLNVYDLKDGANIRLSHSDVAEGESVCLTSSSAKTKESDAQYIHSDKDTAIRYHAGTHQLYMGAESAAPCVCAGAGYGMDGHECEAIFNWTSWGDDEGEKTSLPNTTGNYRLTADVTVTSQTSIPEESTITLDLNGHTVEGTGTKRIYGVNKANSVLNITDTSADYADKPGTIKYSGTTTDQGAIIYMNNADRTNVVNLWNGVLDGSNMTSATKNGPIVCIQAGVMNMFGGSIIGGKTTAGGASVAVNAVFNMHAGTIKNGSAKNGGNIIINPNAVMTMTGGSIEGGTATDKGGNIQVTSGATLNLIGGSVTGGTAATGGNIQVVAGGTLNLDNKAIVSGGTATTEGTEDIDQ